MKKLSGFLGFCLALLLPVVAFAQGATPSVQIITGKGTTGPLNPFPTSSIGPSGYVQGVTIANGGARVAQDPTQLLWDDFRGGGGSVPTGTLDTVFNWQTPTTGGTGTPTAANNQFGATSLGSGTGTGFSILKSQEAFKGVNPGWLYFQENNNFEFPVLLNAVRFWGFGVFPTTPTTAAPYTDAEGFELGTDGHLRAVTATSADGVSAGTRTVINDLSLPCPSTVTATGNVVSGSPTLTLSPVVVVSQYELVTGPNIPFATTVTAVAGAAVTLSSNATATSNQGVYTFTGQCAPGLVGQVAQPQDANVHAYVMYPRGDRIFWTIDGIDNVVAQTYSGAPGPTNNVMNAAHLAVGNTPLSSALININASVVADAARNPIYNGFIRDRTITSASGASQQLFAANFQRHSLTIVNTGNASCGVNPTGGTAAIGGAGTFTLAALGSYTPRIPGRQAVTVICTAGQPIYGDEN
jgi:hypothetical protein